jgi:hypothetical protein
MLNIGDILHNYTQDIEVIKIHGELRQLLEQRKTFFPDVPVKGKKDPALEGVEGLDALVKVLYEKTS